MEVDLGKLFIGGISWDTNEDSLRKYFSAFGEVVEAVIMKDRTTGRARGFGFVVFADPAVTERVVTEKHTIDGRMVEAKKAVPRDDHQFLTKNSSNIHGSPVPGHTKKIFVGGLSSTITEGDFKKYFDQFGTITDVVVMYDHNTQRPRGFGFITYDSEDAVAKVLLNTFHDLNGKMVEVKRAVPKEASPGPIMRSSIGGGYNYGLNRVNSSVNGYAQGYNPSSISGYGMRLDDRLGSLAGGRNGGFGMGMDYEPPLSSTFAGNPGFNNNLGYGRALNPYHNGNPSRYSSLIPYNDVNGITSSLLSLTSRNVWETVALNHATKSAISNESMVSRSGSLGSFGAGNLNWGSTFQFGGSGSSYTGGNLGFGGGGYIGLGRNNFDRRISPTSPNTNLIASSSGYEGSYAKLYGATSVYGDPTWGSSSSQFDGTGSFSYKLNNSNSDIACNGFADYMAGYTTVNNNRQPDGES